MLLNNLSTRIHSGELQLQEFSEQGRSRHGEVVSISELAAEHTGKPSYLRTDIQIN